MKSRQRFCDLAALRKDIFRFAPVWAIYLIGGLLLSLPILSQATQHSSGYRDFYSGVTALESYTAVFSLINLVYALVVAQVLFGDLFNSKLCNALHAMPLRRETWFSTHLVAGLLFSLVPNLIGALAYMPYLDRFWYVSFLWLGGMMLHYLFFLGVAVFSMFVTGKRFAAVVVYGILNFGAVLVYYLLEYLYIPMLYGVVVSTDIMYVFSPIVMLLSSCDYFSLRHDADSCTCTAYRSYIDIPSQHSYHLVVGEAWPYLFILAGVGLVLLGLALLLYRRRKLETAGDFVAFKPMKPVFRIVFTLATATFCHMVAQQMFGMDEISVMAFLFIGLAVGYFVSHMFVERTIKVFKKRTFLGLAAMVGALLLSLNLVQWDVFGIASYIPEPSQVEVVYVSPSNMGRYRVDQTAIAETQYGSCFQSTSLEEIQAVTEAHRLMYQEGEQTGSGTQRHTIYYKLKNGTTVVRCYRVARTGQAYAAACELFKSPYTVLGVTSLEELKAKTISLKVSNLVYSEIYWDGLMEVLWADCQAGKLIGHWNYHEQFHGKEESRHTIHLELLDPETRLESQRTIQIYDCCQNTMQWLEEYQHNSLLAQDYSTEYANSSYIRTPWGDFSEFEDCAWILKMLMHDLLKENARLVEPTQGQWHKLQVDIDGKGQYCAYISTDLGTVYDTIQELLDSDKK